MPEEAALGLWVSHVSLGTVALPQTDFLSAHHCVPLEVGRTLGCRSDSAWKHEEEQDVGAQAAKRRGSGAPLLGDLERGQCCGQDVRGGGWNPDLREAPKKKTRLG